VSIQDRIYFNSFGLCYLVIKGPNKYSIRIQLGTYIKYTTTDF